MDNLSVHESKWVRELVGGRGCQLWLLPSYSPDLINPIEEAFSKAKDLIRKAKARGQLLGVRSSASVAGAMA